MKNKKYKDDLLKFMKVIDSNIKYIKIMPNHSNNIFFIHKLENNECKELPLELESNGIKKIFYLFNFFTVSLKSGMILFVDELDAKLYPLLTRYIINLIHNSETNVGNGQLIYSTHDIVNLNKEKSRRDEIWFAKNDKDGISKIYSLADYKINDVEVRNHATYNKDYLSERYGAIPVLKNFEIL